MTATESAIEIAQRDGHVTPLRLHERTGCALAYAYRLLSALAASGTLRRHKQGEYRLPEVSA